MSLARCVFLIGRAKPVSADQANDRGQVTVGRYDEASRCVGDMYGRALIYEAVSELRP
jgi:hypothetical protein